MQGVEDLDPYACIPALDLATGHPTHSLVEFREGKMRHELGVIGGER